MLRKYGFITIDNGGNGIAYLRVDLIAAISDGLQGQNSQILLEGCATPFPCQDSADTIAKAVLNTQIVWQEHLRDQA